MTLKKLLICILLLTSCGAAIDQNDTWNITISDERGVTWIISMPNGTIISGPDEASLPIISSPDEALLPITHTNPSAPRAPGMGSAEGFRGMSRDRKLPDNDISGIPI